MKNCRKLLYILLFMAFLQGCMGSAYDEKLNGGYYLSAIDTKSEMEIVYKDSQDYVFAIIDATVFAVGQNDRFIIAKQHPKDSSKNINKRITNYFIIPLKEKIAKSAEKNIYGPLKIKEFEQKKEELNIKNVDFTIVFKDIE